MVYILLFFNIIVNEKRTVAKGYFMQNSKFEQPKTDSISKSFGTIKGPDAPSSQKNSSATTQKKSHHKLELDHAHSMSMTGVVDVAVFTDKNITIKLSGENLVVTGQNLSVKTLDTTEGKLVVEGQVFSLKYTSQASPTSFAKKLFR